MTASRSRARWLIALIAATGLIAVVGCTATTAGRGTFAAADDPTDRPTDDPTGGGGEVTRDADARESAVCQLFDDDTLLDLFGGSVSLSVSSEPVTSDQDTTCRFHLTPNDYVDLTVYPDQDATFSMFDDAIPISIGGHPGLEDSITISVSLGDDINELGALQGDNWFSFAKNQQGRDISQAMVERAIGEFETG